jgi:hypothetical protein
MQVKPMLYKFLREDMSVLIHQAFHGTLPIEFEYRDWNFELEEDVLVIQPKDSSDERFITVSFDDGLFFAKEHLGSSNVSEETTNTSESIEDTAEYISDVLYSWS